MFGALSGQPRPPSVFGETNVALLIILAVLAVVFGPSLWCRWVINRYQGDRPDYPGTGGELARHLLDRAGLSDVKVEVTDERDHYDAGDKAVRLGKENHDGRSLTAVAVAAHEVGHAIQDRDDYAPLRTRHRLVNATHGIERVGSVVMLAAPLLGAVSRSPMLMFMVIGVGIFTLAIRVVVHLATLPVEFDASFNRALPILDQGGYLPQRDLPAARRLLTAAAWTYVAGSLATLLNLWRWVRVLR